jgi:hypothetical protein
MIHYDHDQLWHIMTVMIIVTILTHYNVLLTLTAPPLCTNRNTVKPTAAATSLASVAITVGGATCRDYFRRYERSAKRVLKISLLVYPKDAPERRVPKSHDTVRAAKAGQRSTTRRLERGEDRRRARRGRGRVQREGDHDVEAPGAEHALYLAEHRWHLWVI